MFSWLQFISSQIGFSRKEWIFLALVSMALLAMLNFNYLYGFLQSNDEYRFTGLLVNVEDQMTYLSHMEQVRDGHLMLSLLHTSENVPHRIVNFFFLLMGFASFLLPKVIIYHLFRNFLAIFLVILLYYFIGYFIKNNLHRKLTLLFLLFTSGWGIYGMLLNEGNKILSATAYLDFLVPEAHLFSSMYLFPHFLMAIILNLFVYIFLLQYLKTRKKQKVYLAAFTAFILGFTHLYEIITIYAVLTPFLLFKWRHTGDFQHYFKSMIPFYAISILPLLYQFWVVLRYEAYGTLGNTILITPPFLSVLFTFGIFSFFSMILFFPLFTKGENLWSIFPKHFQRQAQEHHDTWLFLTFWIGFNLLLLYFPLPPQRRFIMGLQIPLVILGSIALFYFVVPRVIGWIGRFKKSLDMDRMIENPANKVLVGFWVVLFIFHMVSPFWILALDYFALKNYQPYAYQSRQYYYIPQEIYDGLAYVKEMDLEGTILSNSFIGSWLPTLNGNRVYHGHRSQTLNRAQKEKDYQRFLHKKETAEEKFEFLEINNIAYVVYTDEEREAPVFKDPQYLKLIHSNKRVEIYKVLEQDFLPGYYE